jgi:predicted HicB family RNase H-like nuclease
MDSARERDGQDDMAKRPNKVSRSEQIVVRMEPELRKRIKIAAEQDHRPVGNLVRNVLRDWLDSRSAQAAA